MRIYHAAAAAAALGLLLGFPGVSFASTGDAYNVSGPADGSNVAPSTVVQKRISRERVSADKAIYKEDPQDIGTPDAIGAPGVTAMKGTEAGPSAHPSSS